jgi:hypothetical protein
MGTALRATKNPSRLAIDNSPVPGDNFLTPSTPELLQLLP